ncbi:MAG TPA: dTDP-4-dehydrorhamnose reductase, partial [Deltaproteobacteria bacterium]|nr:dTDP-4-dehydrorhamnose reductase [Deltaproteobacteria bacterium]
EDDVHAAIASFRPHWVVNCAAYTDVDKAEDDEDAALALNTLAPSILARMCARSGARLLHMSTDYVFDGSKNTPYTEEDKPAPLNVYGASKLAGEDAVRHALRDHLIVRTQWLIGRWGKNFVSTIIEAARTKDRLEVVNDQRGCPTFAVDLARALCLLVEMDARGVFHVVNRGSATWYDLACRAVDLAGLGTPVFPVASSAFLRRAQRPLYSVLSSSKFTRYAGKVMPPWQTSLGEYVREYMKIRPVS